MLYSKSHLSILSIFQVKLYLCIPLVPTTTLWGKCPLHPILREKDTGEAGYFAQGPMTDGN